MDRVVSPQAESLCKFGRQPHELRVYRQFEEPGPMMIEFVLTSIEVILIHLPHPILPGERRSRFSISN
jgi:hypothetical protein